MSSFYKSVIRPGAFSLDAETAHEVGIRSLRLGLSTEVAQWAARARYASPEFPVIERFGLRFANPLGVAAGFDKNAIVVNQLAALGFGFVEVGTVTYAPQSGNEKPRLFRLPDDGALINRLGFNNDGAEVISRRLSTLRRKCIVGVNIGKNKDVPNEDAVENYLASFDLIHEHADYIAINVSSPNTPNLRELQQGENLDELLRALSERNQVLSAADNRRPSEDGPRNSKPILVKIAPDLNEGDIEVIVDICVRNGVDGIIATNTTISRDGLKTSKFEQLGTGGLSGKPLANRSNEVIRSIYRHSKGKLPVIGVGGIFTAEDAFEKIAAGACLLQAYTGFIYRGPGFALDINTGLLDILKARGFARLDDAVGSGISG